MKICNDGPFVPEGSAPPVTIRWGTADSMEKLSLPILPRTIKEETSDVAKLLAATQPASFGFDGKDVIDESYRKATKLDTSAFLTNFCPYVAGIIDVLCQTLLPKPGHNSQGIRAELYKLNVSHPSLLFLVAINNAEGL